MSLDLTVFIASKWDSCESCWEWQWEEHDWHLVPGLYFSFHTARQGRRELCEFKRWWICEVVKNWYFLPWEILRFEMWSYLKSEWNIKNLNLWEYFISHNTLSDLIVLIQSYLQNNKVEKECFDCIETKYLRTFKSLDMHHPFLQNVLFFIFFLNWLQWMYLKTPINIVVSKATSPILLFWEGSYIWSYRWQADGVGRGCFWDSTQIKQRNMSFLSALPVMNISLYSFGFSQWDIKLSSPTLSTVSSSQRGRFHQGKNYPHCLKIRQPSLSSCSH